MQKGNKFMWKTKLDKFSGKNLRMTFHVKID